MYTDSGQKHVIRTLAWIMHSTMHGDRVEGVLVVKLSLTPLALLRVPYMNRSIDHLGLVFTADCSEEWVILLKVVLF